MKVLILGASGIVGQHMRLCVPDGVEPVWVRRNGDPITLECDLENSESLEDFLTITRPDVIVNLAGESSVDTVERDPARYRRINVGVPIQLANWCQYSGKRLIQISSQAAKLQPVNYYGNQKRNAENAALNRGQTVMRLTFILGIRPLPHVGRKNPLEAMIEGQSPQVSDRFFSPLMAWDAAEQIWQEVVNPSEEPLIQVGIPERWSRYEIANIVNHNVQPCKHEDFPGIAPRPVDTTYCGSRHESFELGDDIRMVREIARYDRPIELALFFEICHQSALDKLSQGFGPLHNAVSDEWRKRNPKTEYEMLDFYRTTEAYIWELSAYHEDLGFNYSGMCEGIATRLKNEPECQSVLCLGDGIGDLTLTLHRAGLGVWYHDLLGSRTAQYAAFRFWRQTGEYLTAARTETRFHYGPCVTKPFHDAVVSLDFLEHVPNVEDWVRAIHATLRPGGLFFSQNAFNCGSGPEGSMPMHLACNDHWEKDWDPLLSSVGFIQEASNWYRKR
jgi:dTDP-4-dehydrorhamnose reductase/SAM-dependent methyltransferase